MPMAEKHLLARDAKRDIGAELLLSVRQMREGKGKVVARVEVPGICTLPRRNCGKTKLTSEQNPIASQSRHAPL